MEPTDPATPLFADVLAGLRWAAWVTAFVGVMLPFGAAAYVLAAAIQCVRVGWAAGRADHTPPGDAPLSEHGG